MGKYDGQIEFLARGVLIEDRQLLVCRSVKHGYRYLPGGHVEFGEPAAVALAREFMEEAGIDVTVGPPLWIGEHRFEQRGRSRHEFNAVFHVARQAPVQVRSREQAIAFEWVPILADGVDLVPSFMGLWFRDGACVLPQQQPLGSMGFEGSTEVSW